MRDGVGGQDKEIKDSCARCIRIIKNFGAVHTGTYTFRKQGERGQGTRASGGIEQEEKEEEEKKRKNTREAGNEKERKRERVLRFYIRAGRSVTGLIIYPRSFPVSNFHRRLPPPR